MELQLKHLAPYLPYGLRMKAYKNTGKLIKLDDSCVQIKFDKHYSEYHYFMEIKPILRPLSDLTKEIEHNEEKFVPHKKFFREAYQLIQNELEITNNKPLCDYFTWEIMQKLFEWHFDVFGLIEKGLAIDINTLEK